MGKNLCRMKEFTGSRDFGSMQVRLLAKQCIFLQSELSTKVSSHLSQSASLLPGIGARSPTEMLGLGGGKDPAAHLPIKMPQINELLL